MKISHASGGGNRAVPAAARDMDARDLLRHIHKDNAAGRLFLLLYPKLIDKGFLTVSYTHLDVYKRQVGVCVDGGAEVVELHFDAIANVDAVDLD